MALGAALVDRARIVSRQSVALKIDGRTQTAPVHGDWFRARLGTPPKPRTTDAAGGRQRAEAKPILMFGRKVVPLLNIGVKVEVESKEVLGAGVSAIFELDGNPTLYRKRRSVLGGEVTLKRIEDAEMATMPTTPPEEP